MKKALTFIAAVALLASAAVAQPMRLGNYAKAEMSTTRTSAMHHAFKAAGDTISTFPWTEDFEDETTLTGWTFTHNNTSVSTGIGWNDNENYAHSGTGHIFCEYTDATESANQWAITPVIDIPEEANFDLSFYVYTNYWYDVQSSYEVRISTTGADTNNFTTVLYSEVSGLRQYVKHIVSLSEYAGMPVRIAFRHNTAPDGNAMMFDDIRVGSSDVPEVVINGPASVEVGTAATWTAGGSNTFTWTIDGTVQTETSATLIHTFTTTGNHTIVAYAENEAGNDSDTLTVLAYTCENLTIPYTAIFVDNIGCWDTLVLGEEHGFGWFATAEAGLTEGQIYSQSSYSYYGMFMVDLGVDNWIVSPALTTPGTGNYEIAWSVKPYAPSYATDHYGVYLISGTDSILLFEETLNSDMTDYMPRAAAIPSTATGDIQIAFRHFNSTGGYVIIIDDIEVRALTAPTVTLNGPASAQNNMAVTFIANSPNATSYAWTVDGTAQSETGNALTYTFTTTGDHTVSVTAINDAGTSQPATATINIFNCDAISTFPFFEDFENGEISSCWSLIDNDGDGQNWMAMNTTDENTGATNNYMTSFSWFSGIGALTPDNWMILPAIELPDGSSFDFSWKDQGQDPDYVEEHYSVYISTTGRNISDFTSTTAIYEGETEENWIRRTVSLTSYAGQTIYVAFRHHESTDLFRMNIDDIRIGDPEAPEVNLNGPSVVEINTPATFTASGASTFTWTVDGAAQTETGSTLTYTFTTTGNHLVKVSASNSVGSGEASLTVNVFSCDEAIVPLPWNEDFENGEGCWSFFTADAVSNGFAFYNNSQYANNGNYFLLGSYSDNGDVDQYAITPLFSLPANVTDATLTWMVQMNTYQGVDNNYEVLIAEGNTTNVSDFTTVLFADNGSSEGYEKKTVSLSDYAGKTFRIAFHNMTPAEGDAIFIDDITIASASGIDGVSSVNVSLYPNPVSSVLNVEGEGIQQVQVLDINGRSVMTSNHAGSIDMSSLSNGVYVVRVVTADGIRAEKIVKK